ncbi:hypothetical protein ID866_10713 [Astraeus odoratus]|nr:hypothetical protein ID866_10713 [Astraeus odoratus]
MEGAVGVTKHDVT